MTTPEGKRLYPTQAELDAAKVLEYRHKREPTDALHGGPEGERWEYHYTSTGRMTLRKGDRVMHVDSEAQILEVVSELRQLDAALTAMTQRAEDAERREGHLQAELAETLEGMEALQGLKDRIKAKLTKAEVTLTARTQERDEAIGSAQWLSTERERLTLERDDERRERVALLACNKAADIIMTARRERLEQAEAERDAALARVRLLEDDLTHVRRQLYFAENST